MHHAMAAAPASQPLEVQIVEREERRVIVRVKGDAGVGNVDELDRQLLKLTAARSALVVFDLADLRFISSLGLGILLNFHRNASHHGGRVRLAAVRPQVLDMMKKCRLDSVFEIRPSLSDALEGESSQAQHHTDAQ
jgi:anti-sigma B factor antagonist